MGAAWSHAHAQLTHDDENEAQLMTTTAPDVYYDPYDFEIDADPYPVWKRLRDEAPLYYNEKYDFFAVSRYDDVERCLMDWRTYSSAEGSVLELIKAARRPCPRACSSSRTRPSTTCTVASSAGRSRPGASPTSSPRFAASAPRTLDPLVGSGGFDFIADLGTQMPMRTIGMLLGIPEEQQEALRDRIDEGLRLESGEMPESPIAAGTLG